MTTTKDPDANQEGMTAQPVRCCYCGEECNPSYHTDWGIVCGKHCLTNPFTADQPQPMTAMTAMTAEEYYASEYGKEHIQSVMMMQDYVSLLALIDEFASQQVALAVADRDREWEDRIRDDIRALQTSNEKQCAGTLACICNDWAIRKLESLLQ